MIEFAFVPHTSVTADRIEDRMACRMNKLSILAITSLCVLISSVCIMIGILCISGTVGTYAFVVGIIFSVLALVACVFFLYFFYFSSEEFKCASSQEFRFLPIPAVVSALRSYEYISQDAINDVIKDTMQLSTLSSLLDPEAFFLEFPYFNSLIVNHSMKEADRLSREAFLILLGEITWKNCETKILPWLKDPNITPDDFWKLLKDHFGLKDFKKRIATWIRKAYPEIRLPKKHCLDKSIYKGCCKFLLPAENDVQYQRLLHKVCYFSGEFPAMVLGLGCEVPMVLGLPKVPKDLTWEMFMENMPVLLQSKREGHWKISLEDVASL
ncbi:hypothetical protein CPK_ORF00645 [Chlamydia pneumoniae LPCoLN]|uniref:hypothetical protein n=1 Tax=Chlamydia pneumoniae TaxID=83558 RepID=UPI0001BD9D85|nr:hypothetical protein [Chlamydia pneumoniae]ACZ33114.1 hypothetical protein CPK_ORF00645 [Chlamydia pneumoniae LPCoLN]ETR80025.1 hypothetical protein X556_0658 [Chlamydia pneumoniae B21]